MAPKFEKTEIQTNSTNRQTTKKSMAKMAETAQKDAPKNHLTTSKCRALTTTRINEKNRRPTVVS
jgi:hypothetical protein